MSKVNNSSSIVDWLISLGISNLLTSDDILSGNTLHNILKKTVNDYKNEFIIPATAVNKITNWNNLIKQLQKLSIIVNSEDKTQILHGNQSTVYNIMSEVKLYVEEHKKQAQVDINKIDHHADPRQSKSLLQLFILVIIKNLGLNAKQSVALLSNDSKYLAHILAKGFKEQPGPVLSMLNDFQSMLGKIQQFCVNKQNQLFLLKSIKPGLISKFKQVSLLSLNILQKFTLGTSPPANHFELFKTHLLPTFILQFRRHPELLHQIASTIIALSKYSKSLLNVLSQNMPPKQYLMFAYELMLIAEEKNQLTSKGFYGLSKLEDIVQMAIDGLSDSNVFAVAINILIKFLITNPELIIPNTSSLSSMEQQKPLITMLSNLQHLAIHKKSHLFTYINSLFAFLSLFGQRKNPIAPLFFKLCIEKYKVTISTDQSEHFGLNFLYLLQEFPSIPNTLIVDAIAEKYENYNKEVITSLDIEILGRIVLGKRNKDENDYENSIGNEEHTSHPDEKTSLKIYNLLSKLFFEDVANAKYLTEIIIEIIKVNHSSRTIFDLNLKMIKVSLAVYYANIRKLNMSKSIIEGIVKLDDTNSFIKRKNLDIQYLLQSILSLGNSEFNLNVQPLICYSYIQSSAKFKNVQTEGLSKVLSHLGDVKMLIKKYEDDVKVLHDQKHKKAKKHNHERDRSESMENYTASVADLTNKKKLEPGQNYSLYLSKISKISGDAQKGLQKYQKLHLQKLNKKQLQELKRFEEEEKKVLLQKKFTNKVLEKGVRIDPKVENLEQYIYDDGVKESEFQKEKYYDLSFLHMFNPDQEEPNDLEALKYVMKKYNKVLKLYYSIYGGKLRPNSISLFDQLAEKNHLMQVANVWKLWKDHFLDEFMTVRQAQYVVQKINASKKKSYNDMSLLDFEAFEDFIIQASLTMFSRPPKNLSGYSISYMVEQTFYRFRLYATENKIDSRLFEDENTNIQSEGADESTVNLNQKLKENSDYILPEGYKKITEKKVQFFHAISLNAFDDAYSDVLDVLDEIFQEHLGFHIIEPYSEIVTNVYAKSILSKKKQDKSEDFKQKYFSLNMKKQLLNFSHQDRVIARQVAFSISQMMDAVEFGKKYLAQKNMKYTIKQQQQQTRRIQQQQTLKRQKRDKQLKKKLQNHKSVMQQTKRKQQQQQRVVDQRKVQQQRRKRQKYEQQLKRKVEQYQKKKEDERRREDSERQRVKQKQQHAFDKKRQQLQKQNKIIQQKKQTQKKQQQAKQEDKLKRQKSKKLMKPKQKGSPKMSQKQNKVDDKQKGQIIGQVSDNKK